jgi:hypothetical protein
VDSGKSTGDESRHGDTISSREAQEYRLMVDETNQDEMRRRNDQREKSAELSAIFADSYSIDWSSESIRIAFAEYLYGQKHYRVAVVLPMEDAERLGEHLTEIAERAKRARDEK